VICEKRSLQNLQNRAPLQEHRTSAILPQQQQQQLAADITLPLVALGAAAAVGDAVQCESELLQAVRQQQQLLQWLVLQQQQQQQAPPDDRDLMELALVSHC
jgi:hypothetical protein